MALRLPGGLASPKQLWEFLLAKGDTRGRVPPSRYNVSSYYSPTGKVGSVATEYDYFLDETVDLGALDTSFFSMTRSEVEHADPQQRLLLEVARECFEDAGVTNWRGKAIGCYVGSFGEDWVEMFAKEPQQYGIHRVVGHDDSYSLLIRTDRLARGMYGHLPRRLRGCCCRRVNLILGPGMTIAMIEQGVLSKDGSCKTFSADDNGYARGEAITAIYLKPLADAIRDGNPVRAVIRGTAHNVEEALIRRAYQVAGIPDFNATGMVECHGTGTTIGDPIEAKAVARIFGEEGVYIGSVKPNLGHAEGASGLVSVIKMVMALGNRTIPPNIRFTSPNPDIPFESAKLTVPLDPTPWPQSKLERAGINSFGIGGANAHVILDSAASFNAASVFRYPTNKAQLLLYSANSLKSLTKMSAWMPITGAKTWNHLYWFESRLSKEWRQRVHPYHDLLGARVPESTNMEPAWRNLFHLSNAPWVQDHKVGGDVVFPYAGYIALAGEAVKQLTGVTEGFSIRDMTISLALVLPEGRPTELITSFRPVRLTSSLSSQWWEFMVAAYNGQVWNKHCVGEVMAISATSLGSASPEKDEDLPRKIPLTPDEQALESSIGSAKLATARVKLAGATLPQENDYHIHPTVIDGTLQLMSCAATNGQARKYYQVLLAAGIQRVSKDDEQPFPYVVLEVSGIRMSLGNRSVLSDMLDTHAAARYTWGLDIDFVAADRLKKPSLDRSTQTVLLENLAKLCGQTLDQLLSDEVTATLAHFTSQFDMSTFIRTLGHSKPTLRILEIGNERTAPAASIIQSLTLPGNQVLCSKYTFTSKGYISGKDQEKLFSGMDFSTLDISKDLTEQGFEEGEYDLIVTSSIMQATSGSPEEVLSNIKKLLAPQGRLLLQEVNACSTWASYVFGSRPSWWSNTTSAAENGAQSETLTAYLQSKLLEAGLTRTEFLVEDSLSTTILAKPFAPEPKSDIKKVSVLGADHGKEDSIVQWLQESGYEVTKLSVTDSIPSGQDILCLLDRNGPFFESLDSARFDSLKEFLKRLGDAAVAKVFARVQKRVDAGNETLKPDFDYLVKNGLINVGRYYPVVLRDELITSSGPENRAVLDVGTPGRLNTLQWYNCARESLGDDQVEVEVHAAGLNFGDILVTVNIVELPIRQFGMEAAGIVMRVGPNVKDLKIGDRVFCLKTSAFATHLCVPEFSCAKLPDSVKFDEAASMLVPYVTALHSLVNVGGLTKGQSVLIHSACGGVGLTAVQVAQMLEADISTSGVDVVLNSLSGELLHATWSCVAEFGKMVEIGKRDLIGGTKLDMRPANRSYCCVDIDQLWSRPDFLKSLIDSTVSFTKEGRLSPVRPVHVFGADEIQEAFRFMQKGQHIGRVAIALRNLSNGTKMNFQVVPKPREVQFKNSSSYLLVGGLGGLGQAVSQWMVEHNARELIYLSRNAGSPSLKIKSFVRELVSAGCKVKLVPGDATRAEDVAKAVSSATLPLKGILQMSMVLRDENFENMTYEDWCIASAPKIQGTWNIHHATQGADLDFFVLFSSLSGSIGQPGQANYARANTFLDAFVQYRTSHGLAALVVDIGAVEDVGFISQTPPKIVPSGGTTGAAGSNEVLKTFLAAARANPLMLKTAEAESLLALETGKKLFDLLLKPYDELNTTSPLVDLGLDSLVAIELRAWWKQMFGFDISVLEMLGSGSLDALGQRAAEGLLGVVTERQGGKDAKLPDKTLASAFGRAQWLSRLTLCQAASPMISAFSILAISSFDKRPQRQPAASTQQRQRTTQAVYNAWGKYRLSSSFCIQNVGT
ncbi:uncharacterized protein BCR38DRAFT_404090 [Pseudomassariella vexata]|uniref:Uncharacterized protein n=1 Tax=Pseudomassariella vexata TaxID=1141098 RepID=A0A1Y2EHQ5_9PEZI|nr:uncharacterized protein BCR38DRAFT_404090 [Pseudomassariella vexata]ORY70957.1 hypothetical protein BCR38DRAFT_404090 [Pseudomassariella vexata]